MKTIICLVLDRSWSMTGRESDVIGGVNKFIDDQKALTDDASLAMVRFDSPGGPERFREMMDIQKVEHLTSSDYVPRGSTPLLDAIGTTLVQMDKDWIAEKADRAVCVIVTDGYENASHEYTKAKIKEMIQARQDSQKWAFIYLGTDVDAFAEGESYGIPTSNTAGFKKTSSGFRAAFATSSASVGSTRVTGQTVYSNLGKADIEDPNEASIIPPAGGGATVKTTVTWTPPGTAGSVAPPTTITWTPPV